MGREIDKAVKDLEKLKSEHDALTAQARKLEAEIASKRGALGKSVLDGTGNLKELTDELSGASRELDALREAIGYSGELLTDAKRAVDAARQAEALGIVEKCFSDFRKLNSGANGVLDGVYERITKLDEIAQSANDAFSGAIDTMPVPLKQSREVNVRAMKQAVKHVREQADNLKLALGG